MPHLNVPALNLPALPALAEVSALLDELPAEGLDTVSWPDYQYRPEVRFALAYHQECILLKFYVREDAVRAQYRQPNDPVYEDSCVEFFIAFQDDPAYYNLEFNLLGTCQAGYGPGKHGRQPLAPELINIIQTLSTLRVCPSEGQPHPIHWELLLVIPAAVFCYHNLPTLAGQTCRVNFYKCGDLLPQPHFLSWSPVTAPRPEFHLPQYFGTLQLPR